MMQNAHPSRSVSERLLLFYPFDGLIDLFTGFGLVLAGLFAWAGMFWLAGIYPAIFIPLWQSTKRRITAPRLSQVRLEPGQRQRLARAGMMWMGVLVPFLLAGVVLFMLLNDGAPSAGWRTWVGQYLPLLLGLGGATLIGLTALIGRLPHWFLNALTVVLLSGLGFWQGWAGWLILVLVGVVFLLTGSVLLAQFLRENPLPAAEA